MVKVVYDEKTLLEAKNRIDTYNDQILSAMEKIYTEFDNMSSTIKTPRSTKRMPAFIDYYNKKVGFIRNSKENYNKMFDMISEEYHNYTNTVKEMVGGNNGK